MKISSFLNETTLILESIEGKMAYLLPLYLKKGVKEEDAKKRIESFIEADPTITKDPTTGEFKGTGDYLRWLGKLDLNKTSIFPEDNEKVRGYINQFIQFKNKRMPQELIDKTIADYEKAKKKTAGFVSPPKFNHNIDVYNTAADLSDSLAPFHYAVKKAMKSTDKAKAGGVVGKKALIRDKGMAGVELAFEDGTYKIEKITTTEALCAPGDKGRARVSDEAEYAELGSPSNNEIGRHWCVKDPKWAESYIEGGKKPFLLIYKKRPLTESEKEFIKENEGREAAPEEYRKYVLMNAKDMKDIKDRDLSEAQQLEILDLLLRTNLYNFVEYPFLVNAARNGNMEVMQKILSMQEKSKKTK
jgi:hypothetical protein